MGSIPLEVPTILVIGWSWKQVVIAISGVYKQSKRHLGCIGVPYGAALWQVGDSKEQNGSFNISITKAKDDLLVFKESIGLSICLVPTDMIHNVNSTWKKSSPRIIDYKNAIFNRGWNPLNHALLLNQ